MGLGGIVVGFIIFWGSLFVCLGGWFCGFHLFVGFFHCLIGWWVSLRIFGEREMRWGPYVHFHPEWQKNVE